MPQQGPSRTPEHTVPHPGDRAMTTQTNLDSTIVAPPLPNGVNATAVVEFANRLQADTPADGTAFKAQVRWRGGFRNEILVRDLPPTYADEPLELGGTNTASN